MKQVNVVLFSGGRGSRPLTEQLVTHPHVHLTLAINGYDDGLSTGEVRRFLGDSLGPSDFRKNASTVARALDCCDSSLIELLDLRLPDGFTAAEAQTILQQVRGGQGATNTAFGNKLDALLQQLSPDARAALADRLDAFAEELSRQDNRFNFSDCSLGNLVFAGCFLLQDRDFNNTIRDYCELMNVPRDMVINVTDGTNAFLVAMDRGGGLLASEAAIVDGGERSYIDEIYLVDRPPAEWLETGVSGAALTQVLQAHSQEVLLNPVLTDRIATADVIVYAPGTQHSSLLPSYMSPCLGQTIAMNTSAVKVLVTNIQEDAEIPDISAVEITDKALYYLRERNRRHIPAPFLITHYLLNDPARAETGVPYVPLGQLHNIEDPRLVRIANFEDGVSGRHNAQKVLMPFIDSFVDREKRPAVAIVLLDTDSLDKVSQSVIEATRAGLDDIKIDPVFFFRCREALDEEVLAALPFRMRNIDSSGPGKDPLLQAIKGEQIYYVILFESSGMYRGEDVVGLAALLAGNRLDAVWGSRRLSVREIRESYHLRYRKSRVLGAVSYLGSYLLSLTFLFLFGRYISDALSGARAIRADYLQDTGLSLDDKRLNFNLLSRVLRDQGEVFETPVHFFSLSPEKANRTSIMDGLRSILEIFKWRIRRR